MEFTAASEFFNTAILNASPSRSAKRAWKACTTTERLQSSCHAGGCRHLRVELTKIIESY
jgi:hypothetical protein